MKNHFWRQLLISIAVFAGGMLLCGIFCLAGGISVKAEEDPWISACTSSGGVFDYTTWACDYTGASSANYYVSDDQACWNNGGTFDYTTWTCSYVPAYTSYNYFSDDQACWNNGGTFDYTTWTCNYVPAYTSYNYVSDDQACWNNGGTFDYGSWTCSYAPAKSYSYADYSYNTGYSGGTTYVGNASKHRFHYAWCSSVSQMADHNKVYSDDRSYFINLGYQPCKRCHP